MAGEHKQSGRSAATQRRAAAADAVEPVPVSSKASIPNAWSLFLDDEREPKTNRAWIIARSFHEAKALCLSLGCPHYISFDHDLGGPVTGHDFAHWMVRHDIENPGFIPPTFAYVAHTANVVGRANIEGLLDSYLKHRPAQGTLIRQDGDGTQIAAPLVSGPVGNADAPKGGQ